MAFFWPTNPGLPHPAYGKGTLNPILSVDNVGIAIYEVRFDGGSATLCVRQ